MKLIKKYAKELFIEALFIKEKWQYFEFSTTGRCAVLLWSTPG